MGYFGFKILKMRTERELKFRAWNKTWKMMSPVDKIEFENGRPSSVSVTIKATDFDHTGEWEDCEVGKEVILQQNTGLKDKNGKEIFEGDLVRVDLTSDDISEEYRGRVFIWTANMRLGDDETHNIAILEPSHLEIIGNIFANPELLEQ